jgi:hypothetical protein
MTSKTITIDVSDGELADNFSIDIIPMEDKYITIYTHKQTNEVYTCTSYRLVKFNAVFPYSKLKKKTWF